MMTNNMMSNINKNKFNMNKYDEQYSTGKKIQRPSDDPIVAVRALKLRTNLVQLNQYLDKNIPDALSWMDVTESALKNVNQILTDMNSYCVDGSNDDLTVDNRNSIINNLMELQKHIYQEGDANYAGRYVFTGYKTDKSLIFNSTDKMSDYQYNITEDFKVKDIDTISKVVGSYAVPTDTSIITTGTYAQAPTTVDTYRIRLAYDTLDAYKAADANFKLTYSIPGTPSPTVKTIPNPPTTTMTTISDSKTAGAYQPGDNEVAFLADTGEVILGKNVYNDMRKAESISVNYDKSKFEEGDLRPEHYFNCSKYKLDSTGARISDGAGGYVKDVTYTKEDQDIEYEINFNLT
jgi:flagellar hook-associated protein 3 FlgL